MESMYSLTSDICISGGSRNSHREVQVYATRTIDLMADLQKRLPF